MLAPRQLAAMRRGLRTSERWARPLRLHRRHAGHHPRQKKGKLVRFSFTNVRCVPGFKYTLLSVTQLWEEQGIDARFADLKHLQFPPSAGSIAVPYDSSLRLSTLVLVSDAELQQCLRRDAKGGPPSRDGEPTQSALLGFHKPTAVSHIEGMSAAQAGELIHRRRHQGVAKTRALPDITSDAPKNLRSSPVVSCPFCAASRVNKASHSGNLLPPAPSPGSRIHVDIKTMTRSIGNLSYAVFFTDEFSRYVWVEFLVNRGELINATKRFIARFDAEVGVPVDDNGKPLPHPRVVELRRDHEGQYESLAFREFRADQSLHETCSPPHDHDLNPIAESIINSISTLASSIRGCSGAPPSFWPWVVRHAVDIHNSSVASVGTSTTDSRLTPFQSSRFASLAAWIYCASAAAPSS